MFEAPKGSRPGSTGIDGPATAKRATSNGSSKVWGDIRKMGFAVSILDSVDAITGEFKQTIRGVCYPAGTIIFLRYHEMESELRSVVGRLEKRTSEFERSLGKFEICEYEYQGRGATDPASKYPLRNARWNKSRTGPPG